MAGPKTAPEMQQIPVRVHVNDYKILKKLLVDDELTFQALAHSLIQAYIDGNKYAIAIVHAYKEANEVPHVIRESKVLSQRERDSILKELEKEEGKAT